MKRVTGLVCALLVLAPLGACGSDDSGDSGSSSSASGAYCDDLKAAKAQFDDLDNADLSQLGDVVDTLDGLGAEAPDDIAADWTILTDGLDKFIAALDAAGLKPEDLSDPSALDPSNLDPGALQTLTEVSQELGGKEFQAASKNIQDHALSECDVQLGDTTSTPSG